MSQEAPHRNASRRCSPSWGLCTSQDLDLGWLEETSGADLHSAQHGSTRHYGLGVAAERPVKCDDPILEPLHGLRMSRDQDAKCASIHKQGCVQSLCIQASEQFLQSCYKQASASQIPDDTPQTELNALCQSDTCCLTGACSSVDGSSFVKNQAACQDDSSLQRMVVSRCLHGTSTKSTTYPENGKSSLDMSLILSWCSAIIC